MYPGCHDVACSSSSWYCKNGIWAFECNKHRNPKDDKYCYYHSDSGYNGFIACPDPPVECSKVDVVLGSGTCNGSLATFGACALSEPELSAASNRWKQDMEGRYSDDQCSNETKRQDAFCSRIGSKVSDICGASAPGFCASAIETFQHECYRDADCSFLAIENVSRPLKKPLCCSVLKRRYEATCQNVNSSLLDALISELRAGIPPGCTDQNCHAGGGVRRPDALPSLILLAFIFFVQA